jgi:transcriptional regulator GlxA family with amidase domain
MYLIYLLIASITAYSYYLQKKKKLTIRETVGSGIASGNRLTPRIAPGNRAEEALLKNLLEALEKNYSDEDFDIATLCRTLGMSRAQCYRKITALTGEPVAHLISNFRLQKAKDLLATSSLSISQIALEVGFKDLAHFSHCFHHYYGINASEIRKRDAATKD